MNAREQREPSPDELRAMAYVDDELNADDRQQFEVDLARDSVLAREVAELRALEIVTRQMAPPEPMDHEWERLNKEPMQRVGLGMGFTLALVGSVGLGVWICWQIASDASLNLVPKCLLLGTVLGFVILFLLVLRGRMRTLPYDSYTDIKR